MEPALCSTYEVGTSAELHDLASGTLGHLLWILLALAMLIGGWRRLSSIAGRPSASLFLVVALAFGAGASWLGGQLVTTHAICRGPGTRGLAAPDLVAHVERRGVPAYYQARAVEGDSTPAHTMRLGSALVDSAVWAGVVLAAIALVRTRLRSRSPRAPTT